MTQRLIILFIIILPIFAGLFFSIIPAFGFFPQFGITNFSLESFKNFYNEPGIIFSISKSLFIGIVSTVISWWITMLLLGNFYKQKFFKIINNLLLPVLTIPHASMAIGLLFLFQPSGFIMRLISPEISGWQFPQNEITLGNDTFIIIITLIVKEVPFLLLISLSALTQFNADEKISISRSFGYSKMQSWFYIIQPEIFKLIKIPIFVVLVFSTTVVDVVAVISTSTIHPLALKVFLWSKEPFIDSKYNASVGMLVLIIISILSCFIFLISQKLFSKLIKSYLINFGFSKNKKRVFIIHNIFITYISFSILFLVTGSFLLLIIWSFTENWFFPDNFPTSITIYYWENFTINNFHLLKNTLIVGVASSILSVIISIIWLENNSKIINNNLENVFYIPLLLPQASFLFGVKYIFYKLGISGTYFGIICSHIIFVFPYVFLCLASFWRSFDQNFIYFSRSLGNRYWYTFFKIKVSILSVPLFISLSVGFLISNSLYLPTAFISEGKILTLTTEFVSFATGNSRQILGVTATIQMLLPTIIFVLAGYIYLIKSRKFSYFKI